MKKPDVPQGKSDIPEEVLWSLADKWYGDEWTDMAGMNQREEEDFLLLYGSREERKAIKKRRQAEEAQRKQSKT